MGSQCVRCEKDIRFYPQKEAEAPGTIRGYKKTGLCVMCTREDLKKIPPKVETVLPKCHGCCRPMRPHKARKSGWPGTVARVRNDTCQSCHEKERRGLPEYEIEARSLDVPDLSIREKMSATRLIMRSGGDILILEALGLTDVYVEMR